MRTKTEARRLDLLKAAADVFAERGYAGASMSAIAARAGGSKGTLYGYFRSKEELLVAMIREDAGPHIRRWLDRLQGEPDLGDGLAAFGREYLRVLLAPRTVEISRLLIGQCEAPEVSREAYEQGLGRTWTQVAAVLATAMGEGRLRRADPWRAAMHFKGLLGADHVERRLYGALVETPPELLAETADAAAEAFLRLYGP